MTKNEKDSEGTHYLNVDLDIYSTKADLQPLVSALGEKVVALHVGRHKRTYSAHLEIWRPRSADATIRGFCRLIAALPRAQRKLWDTAKTREFSIGIQACNHPRSFELALSVEAVEAAAELGARISVTVYAPQDSDCWKLLDSGS